MLQSDVAVIDDEADFGIIFWAVCTVLRCIVQQSRKFGWGKVDWPFGQQRLLNEQPNLRTSSQYNLQLKKASVG